MLALLSVTVVLVALFGASLLVERLLGRSRKEFRKPGWFLVFYGLFIPAGALVYFGVEVSSPFLYAAYCLVGGVAALIGQCLYGVRLPKHRSGGQ